MIGPRRASAVVLALALVGLVSAAPGGAARTDAAWTDAEYASATFTAANGVLPPSALRCVPRTSVVTFAVPLSWTAPSATVGYVLPAAYEVQVQTTAGTTVYDAYVSSNSTVLTADLLTIGTYTIRVRGVTAGHSWTSAWITDGLSILSPVGYSCTA